MMPKHAGGQAAQRGVARQDGDHGDAEHRERQQFGRAEEQHHRTHDRHGDRHQERAEDAAHERRHVGGAESASAFAVLGHREAVERGRGGRRAARHAEHDGRDRIAGRGGRGKAEQQREAPHTGPC